MVSPPPLLNQRAREAYRHPAHGADGQERQGAVHEDLPPVQAVGLRATEEPRWDAGPIQTCGQFGRGSSWIEMNCQRPHMRIPNHPLHIGIFSERVGHRSAEVLVCRTEANTHPSWDGMDHARCCGKRDAAWTHSASRQLRYSSSSIGRAGRGDHIFDGACGRLGAGNGDLKSLGDPTPSASSSRLAPMSSFDESCCEPAADAGIRISPP